MVSGEHTARLAPALHGPIGPRAATANPRVGPHVEAPATAPKVLNPGADTFVSQASRNARMIARPGVSPGPWSALAAPGQSVGRSAPLSHPGCAAHSAHPSETRPNGQTYVDRRDSSGGDPGGRAQWKPSRRIRLRERHQEAA